MVELQWEEIFHKAIYQMSWPLENQRRQNPCGIPFSTDIPVDEVFSAGHVAGAIRQEENTHACNLEGLVKRSVRYVK